MTLEKLDEGTFLRQTGMEGDDLKALLRLPMFHGLDSAVVRTVLAEAHVRPYSKDKLLFSQDDPANAFYVVFSGWAKLFRLSEGGHEAVIALIGPAESFAEAAMFDSGVYPVNAAVVEDARMLVVPATPFLARLHEDPDLCFQIMGAMSHWLRHFVQEVEQLTAHTTSERLADFLLKLCPRQQTGPTTIHLPTDKSLIAGRLGMQPETFSRSLAKLRPLGVETHGQNIVVQDVGALQQALPR
jgi:CRP/FNR family transcriptional regulator, dissimilatory nitrate respiration regulator